MNQSLHTKKIQIKHLEIGMKIKTKNIQGEIVFKTVTDKFNTIVTANDQVRLVFKNNVMLNCSVNHPIMVWEEETFKQKLPYELTTKDLIVTEHGFTSLVTIDSGQHNNEDYIDITVDDTHTFFAAASEDGDMVLTHNSQGGIRNASATITYPIWHYQFDDLIVLKNNQGTDETRVRHLDYSVVLSAFFWRRFKNKENITFFDPNEVPDLYEAFYTDTVLFEELYVQYEKTEGVRKKTMSAEEVFKGGLLKERTDTGRIYLVFIDNVIKQGPFDPKHHTIYQSNLCLTGDTTIQIMNTDTTVQSLSLLSFVEQFEFGAMHDVKVRSYNIVTGKVTWNTVTNAAKTATVTTLIEIEDETGKIIRCTPDHQIYTKNRGYVNACDLLETDMLCVES